MKQFDSITAPNFAQLANLLRLKDNLGLLEYIKARREGSFWDSAALKNNDGWTEAMVIFQKGDSEAIRAYIKARGGASLQETAVLENNDGWTEAMFIFRYGDSAAIQAYIKARGEASLRATATIQDKLGWTEAMFIFTYGDSAAIQAYIEARGSASLQETAKLCDKDDWTEAMFIFDNADSVAIRAYIKARGKASLQETAALENNDGWTEAMLIFRYGDSIARQAYIKMRGKASLRNTASLHNKAGWTEGMFIFRYGDSAAILAYIKARGEASLKETAKLQTNDGLTEAMLIFKYGDSAAKQVYIKALGATNLLLTPGKLPFTDALIKQLILSTDDKIKDADALKPENRKKLFNSAVTSCHDIEQFKDLCKILGCDETDVSSESIKHFAGKAEQATLLERCVKKTLSLQKSLTSGMDSFWRVAIDTKNHALLKILKQENACHINLPGQDKLTPLQRALQAQDNKAILILVNSGAKINSDLIVWCQQQTQAGKLHLRHWFCILWSCPKPELKKISNNIRALKKQKVDIKSLKKNISAISVVGLFITQYLSVFLGESKASSYTVERVGATITVTNPPTSIEMFEKFLKSIDDKVVIDRDFNSISFTFSLGKLIALRGNVKALPLCVNLKKLINKPPTKLLEGSRQSIWVKKKRKLEAKTKRERSVSPEKGKDVSHEEDAKAWRIQIETMPKAQKSITKVEEDRLIPELKVKPKSPPASMPSSSIEFFHFGETKPVTTIVNKSGKAKAKSKTTRRIRAQESKIKQVRIANVILEQLVHLKSLPDAYKYTSTTTAPLKSYSVAIMRILRLSLLLNIKNDRLNRLSNQLVHQMQCAVYASKNQELLYDLLKNISNTLFESIEKKFAGKTSIALYIKNRRGHHQQFLDCIQQHFNAESSSLLIEILLAFESEIITKDIIPTLSDESIHHYYELMQHAVSDLLDSTGSRSPDGERLFAANTVGEAWQSITRHYKDKWKLATIGDTTAFSVRQQRMIKEKLITKDSVKTLEQFRQIKIDLGHKTKSDSTIVRALPDPEALKLLHDELTRLCKAHDAPKTFMLSG